MIGDIGVKTNLYIICGYTDYPRSIIIREVCVKADVCWTSDNTSQIIITHISLLYITTIRRYCCNARKELFI